MAAMRSRPFGDLRDAALLGKHCDPFAVSLFAVLDRFEQFGVSLAHDLVELRGPHPGFLHLLEWPSGVHALVLAVSPMTSTRSSGLSFLEERSHLFGAGKARLVQHVEMAAGSARRSGDSGHGRGSSEVVASIPASRS